MDDLFWKLSAGAKFSRKTLVAEKKKRQKSKTITKKVTESDTGALPRELDFFGSSSVGGGRGGEETLTKSMEGKKKRQKIPKGPIFQTDLEMSCFRKKNGIKVYGDQVPLPIRRFVDLSRPCFGVPEMITETVINSGLKKPTPVQMQAISVLLAGRDAFVTAPTGSGKTLVFVISILARLLKQEKRPSSTKGKVEALIVSPTRELALQIRNEFRRFTPPTVDSEGGESIIKSVLLNKTVLNSWESKRPTNFPSILVTTPKSLVNAINKKIIDLSNVQQIMLDEADKLLDLGLMEQMDDILAACTFKDGPIQKVLFSATIPSGVEDLARSFMNDDPIRVVVGKPNAAASKIKQELVYVGQEEGKIMAIRQMLVEGLEPPVIIFTETIERAQELFRELVHHGINVDIINSSRTQVERERVISQFRAGRIWFLITTELLARGLDFPQVSCVINYDFPLSTASYIHRIGRTGRAGQRGKAITLFTKDDSDALRIVANVMRESGCDVPDWMLKLQRNSTKSILRGRKRKFYQNVQQQ